jgi:hypothetical protein
MDDNELLLAVRDARRELQEGDKPKPKYRTEDMLDILEGLATFLDRDALVKLKCSTCDHYSRSSFSVPGDFTTVDQTEYCHARKISLPHLKILRIAGCKDYSKEAQRDLVDLATAVLEEDLRPSFEERKLYDRQQFTSHTAEFRMNVDCGRACIEFGHMAGDEFVSADIRLYILRRIDPGLGPGTEKIAKVIRDRPVLAVAMSCKTRKMADIDYVLDWIAGKRKMDIVYL